MITTQQMKALENNCGISKLQLMENAGKGIYNIIKEKFPDLKDKKILIAAYHGNNGGDGFVAARCLCEEAETDVLFIGDEANLKEEASINFRRIEHNVKIQILIEQEQINFNDYDIIIDALLGTGVQSAIKEPISSIIDMINESKAYKIAVDVPTGLNPNSGEVAKMVCADMIVCFHDIKHGLIRFKDKTVVVDIGINKRYK